MATAMHRPNPRADMNTEDVRRFAKMYGLEVGTHAPGDGVRRYQFIEGQGSSKRIVFTGLGLREAEVWLRGYMTAADLFAPPGGGFRGSTHDENPRKGPREDRLSGYLDSDRYGTRLTTFNGNATEWRYDSTVSNWRTEDGDRVYAIKLKKGSGRNTMYAGGLWLGDKGTLFRGRIFGRLEGTHGYNAENEASNQALSEAEYWARIDQENEDSETED